MKLIPVHRFEPTPIGDNYSNLEILDMLEHQFPNPPPLLALVKQRFERVIFNRTSAAPQAFRVDEDVPDTSMHEVRCPCCGTSLIAVVEDER